MLIYIHTLFPLSFGRQRKWNPLSLDNSNSFKVIDTAYVNSSVFTPDHIWKDRGDVVQGAAAHELLQPAMSRD